MKCDSHPSFYLSAPTSPSRLSPKTVQFYSTWSSPVHQTGSGSFGYESNAYKTTNDEFEFEFETGKWFDDKWDQDDQKYRLPARADSFSNISFADELFCKGQVLPLKPPPRLQSSVPTSPNRSFSSRVKSPFSQRCTWNDGFDPFMMALEKVSEEPEGRVSVHRRSRSYSPLRTGNVSRRVNCTVDSDNGEEKEPTATDMVDRKGAMYSRWVRSQTMVKKRSEWSMQNNPTARTMIKRLCLGRIEPVKPNERASTRESKMQKLKSVLLRYASLKRETNESKTVTKVSYFKRLRHSFKTNPMKKESNSEPKMSIIKHDTKRTRSLIYAHGSPKWLL